jgi:hypothetical protein
MAKKPNRAKDVAEAQALAVVVTPHESTDQLGAAVAKGSRAVSRAADMAKGAVESIGRSTGSAAKASANAVANASARVGEKAAATFHVVGDLNGDGRADVEDFRIAKAAVGKVAVDFGGEALDLGKAAMRHQLVKDAAAGALVGGAVASVVPFVGIPLGAAAGAAMVLVQGATGEIIGKSAGRAMDLAEKVMTKSIPKPKPKTKRSRVKPKPKS